MSKRFVFRLEAALRQRERDEQGVQVELARVAAWRREAMAELAARRDELARATGIVAGLGEAFDPVGRMNVLYYVDRARQAVRQQETIVARCEGEVSRVQEVLRAAAARRRALERLKERQERRFYDDIARRAEKDLDELVVARHGRVAASGGIGVV